MAKFKVEVNGIERTLREIKRDIHHGMRKSVDNLVDNARDHAREVISQNDAIFNAEVYQGFRDAETRNTPSNIRAKLYNDVDHADVLEDGAAFTAKGPPVEALLPWVSRKMDWKPDGDFDLGNEGRPDSFDGDNDDDDDDGSGSNAGTSPGSFSDEDTTAVSQQTLDEDTTDDGLTLSTQADDLSINGGSLVGLRKRSRRESLLNIESIHRDSKMPHVDSISANHYDSVEEAFNDDSGTINIPNNLIEWDTGFRGANIESLFDEDYYKVEYDQHLEYVIDHQYGSYVYDNLSYTGRNEFRKYWGFTETDSGWELPDDASEISGLAATSERAFFSEVYVKKERESYGYQNPSKRDFFERIEDKYTAYFSDEFLDKPTGTPDYNVGYDYSGDREVVLEGDLDGYATRDTAEFTTDFNNYYYLEGHREPVFKDWTEYIFTHDDGGFEGAKVLEHHDGKFSDGENMEFDAEDLTLQAIPATEKRWNNLENDDEILIQGHGEHGSEIEEVWSVKPSTFDDSHHVYNEDAISDGRRVFNDDIVQIDYKNIIGYREDYPDLWGENFEIVQTVNDEDLPESLTSSFATDEDLSKQISNTIDDEGYFVLKDSSGDQYRAERHDDIGYDYKSIRQNNEGDFLEWNEDEIEVTHLSEKSVNYGNIERGDNILVNPDELDGDSEFTDYTYRATVETVDNYDTPIVTPFGSNTNKGEDVSYDSFQGRREDIPGWNAKNWDRGREVTIETYSGEATGNIRILEDGKGYELGTMRLETEDHEEHHFKATDVISSQKTDFMEQGEDPGSSLDLSLTEYKKYDGEIPLDELYASKFDPLDGVDELEPGTDFTFRANGNIYHDTVRTALYDSNDNRAYRTEDGRKITADLITGFDTQGVESYEVSEGDTISNGSSFGEVLNIRDGVDGNKDSLEVDFTGDGNYDDLLTYKEVQTVDQSAPEGSEVMFWSYREGERKTGTVTKKSGGGIYIETENGDEYDTFNNLYPITIEGVSV